MFWIEYKIGCSCGGVGELGVPGECEQPGVVPYAVHAFLAVGSG